MADILTQIQDELDMPLHQMQASLTYIKTRAPPAAIPGQPLFSSFAEHEAQAQSQSTSNPSQPSQMTTVAPPLPPSQEKFQRDIRELSRDLLLKEQQIEILIGSLPGLNASEKEQIERMKIWSSSWRRLRARGWRRSKRRNAGENGGRQNMQYRRGPVRDG